MPKQVVQPQMRRLVVGRHAGEHPARALVLGFIAAGRGRRGIDGQPMSCTVELSRVTRRSVAIGLGLDERLVARLVDELVASGDAVSNGDGLDVVAARLAYRWREGVRLDYVLPLRSSPQAELLAAAIRAMGRRRTALCEPSLAKLLDLSRSQVARVMRRAVADGLVVRRLSGGRWWTSADPVEVASCRSAPPVLQKRTPDAAFPHPECCISAPHHQEVRTAGLPDYAPLRLVGSDDEQQTRLRRDDPAAAPAAVPPEPNKGRTEPVALGPIPPVGAPIEQESHNERDHGRRPLSWTEKDRIENQAVAARSSWSAFNELLRDPQTLALADGRTADAWFVTLTVLGVFVPASAVSQSGRMGHRRKRQDLAAELARRCEDASTGLEWAGLQARDMQASGQRPSELAAKFMTTVVERSDDYRERNRQRTAEGLPPHSCSVELTRLVQPQKRPFVLKHALTMREQQRIADVAALAQQVQAVKVAELLGGQVAHRRAVAHFRDAANVDRLRDELRAALAMRDGSKAARCVQRLHRLGVVADELRAAAATAGLLPAVRTGTA